MTAGKSRRVRRKVGDILRVDLGLGRHAYAQVSEEPLMIFFDGVFSDELPIEAIPRLPAAFRLWVYNHAVTKGVWTVIGSQPLTPANSREPFFFRQDAASGRLLLYHSSLAGPTYERPASLAECAGLECAAVWEPEHVVDRLNDHAARRPNIWTQSMKIDVEAIPA